MGIITGTGLASGSDVANTFMQHIIDEIATPPSGAGAVITRDRSTGTVGSDNVEQWLTMPANRMSMGADQLFGLNAVVETNAIAMNLSRLDFTTASDSDSNTFLRFLGQPNNVADDGVAQTSDPMAPRSNGWDLSPPYLRHWIFTNPNFGALTTEYDAGEETYIYMVVEIAANQYRHFGWCCVKQLGDWPDTNAGFYMFGSYIQNGSSIGSTSFSTSNTFMGSVFMRTLSATGSPPGGGGDDGTPNVLWGKNRDGATSQYITSDTFTTYRYMDTLSSNEMRTIGRDLQRSPSTFSGIAMRIPIQLYASRKTLAQQTATTSFGDANMTWQLIAELPDVFFLNIRDLDPGTVFLSGTDKFLVMPLYEKGGLSGNNGILIKNPGL